MFFFEPGDKLKLPGELDMDFGMESVHECEVKNRRVKG